MFKAEIKMKLPVALAASAMLCLAANASAMQCTAASGERRVALLELYTSEGCDSCPPTDRWVSGLPDRGFDLERLVVLGFHVDYWNYLGWPDPFAQKKFSERQHASTTRNGARVVYTPQLLFDGKDYRRGVGPDDFGVRIAAAITLRLRQAPENNLTVNGAVTIRDAAVRNAAQAYLALYENHLSNRITAGENRGKQLQHDFVVRELAGPFPVAAGKPSDFSHSFRIAPNWKTKDLRVAAFVQHSGSGEVLQALVLPHCGQPRDGQNAQAPSG
jgi:hypothetical protein